MLLKISKYSGGWVNISLHANSSGLQNIIVKERVIVVSEIVVIRVYYTCIK